MGLVRSATGVVRVGVVVLGSAITGFAAAYSWPRSEPAIWGADLVVGLAFTMLAAAALQHSPATAGLALLVTVTWAIAAAAPIAMMWHRAVLLQLILAMPRARPATVGATIVVIVGYAVSATPLPWLDDRVASWIAVAGAAALIAGVAGIARTHRPSGRRRLGAAAVLLAGVVGAIACRYLVPGSAGIELAYLWYAISLIAVAITVAVVLPRLSGSGLAERAVQLGEQRHTGVLEALAEALGDPTLEIGSWSSSRGEYVDRLGRPVDADRVARAVERVEVEGSPSMVIVHDPRIPVDARLGAAIARAVQRDAENARLMKELGVHTDEVAASRSRIIAAVATERGRIGRDLAVDVIVPLQTLARRLSTLSQQASASAASLAKAAGLADRARRETAEIGGGEHPSALRAGLAAALSALAERSPVAVSWRVPDQRLPKRIESVLFYTCSEALTNAIHHAGAARIEIDLDATAELATLTVSDDGAGGAESSRGTGLRGLIERVEHERGHVLVDSPSGGGTRVTVLLPIPQADTIPEIRARADTTEVAP